MLPGQADPIVEKDALTQEEKWFEFSEFEQRFLNMPVPELLELIEAADFLDIRSLYECAHQAIAALIKGKRHVEVRQILQQARDLTADDIDGVFERSPWLGSRYKRDLYRRDSSGFPVCGFRMEPKVEFHYQFEDIPGRVSMVGLDVCY